MSKKDPYFVAMRLWIAKIFMLCAVTIITVHNIVPHDHDHIIVLSHHDNDHDNDHDDDNIFSYNFLAHTFVQQYFHFTIAKQAVASVPQVIFIPQVCYTDEYFWVDKVSYALKQEFPPPDPHTSSSGFCGPPYIV